MSKNVLKLNHTVRMNFFVKGKKNWSSVIFLVRSTARPSFAGVYHSYLGFPGGASGKDPANAGDMRCASDPWIRKIPWRSAWQPILAWRIPWTEEPGRLQSIGSQRVRHDWSDIARTLHSCLPIAILLWQFSELEAALTSHIALPCGHLEFELRNSS